jgi:hypothetical protein
MFASHAGDPGSCLRSSDWGETGLWSSDCGEGPTLAEIIVMGLRSSDSGDKPTELRSWSGLTELRLWQQAYRAQIVATGDGPTAELRLWQQPTELALWRRAYGAQIVAPAYGAQIVATGLWSSDRGTGLLSSDHGDWPSKLRLCRRAYGAQCAQIVAQAYEYQIRRITVPAITTSTFYTFTHRGSRPALYAFSFRVLGSVPNQTTAI